MQERLSVFSFNLVDPDQTAAVGDAFLTFTTLADLTIVGVSVAPAEDDPGATLDINDDGTGVISAVACATAATPGTWQATGYGGSNDPVVIAAGSKVSFDVNNGAAANNFLVVITALVGEKWV